MGFESNGNKYNGFWNIMIFACHLVFQVNCSLLMSNISSVYLTHWISPGVTKFMPSDNPVILGGLFLNGKYGGMWLPMLNR